MLISAKPLIVSMAVVTSVDVLAYYAVLILIAWAIVIRSDVPKTVGIRHVAGKLIVDDVVTSVDC